MPSVDEAIFKFDEENAKDPTLISVDGILRPQELVHAERLSAWVSRVVDSPSDALRLAARCQHLKRFSFPRSDYPEGRVGYLKWRKDLSHKHADLAGQILDQLGFSAEIQSQVRSINLKQELKTNPDAQAMEDALCLAFLEHEYSAFAEKYPDEKVIDILQKTWRKMSPRGHELALTLPLSGRAAELVKQALELYL